MWQRNTLWRKRMVQFLGNDSLLLLHESTKENLSLLLISLKNCFVSGPTLLVLIVTDIITSHEIYLTPCAYSNN